MINISNPAAPVADDFKAICGIGPAVEQRLHAAGIQSYAQLAALDPHEIAAILHNLIGCSAVRIQQQDWCGQAVKLAEQNAPPALQKPSEAENNSLHYASYSLELLLDRENQVRRTRAVHVQSHSESAWAGWDQERLGAFLVESGGLKVVPETVPASPGANSLPALQHEVQHTVPRATAAPAARLHGEVRVLERSLRSGAGLHLQNFIEHDMPFFVHLELDLSQVEALPGEELACDACLYKRNVGARRAEQISTVSSVLPLGARANIALECQPLAPGDYRLDALVTVRPHAQPRQSMSRLVAFSENLHLHVL